MTSFDFITDEDFRISLEKDFKELNSCIQVGAYKAAVVIAGSIVESVLIDYVIAENIVSREDALKMDFGKVLTLCKDKKIISQKTSDLSSAIKGYRNLIHPGRALRLNENVDKDSADVSKALVNIVLSEVEKQKKENYGYTAEQIVSKIRNDSNVVAVLPLLIKKTNVIELERLMFKYLPEAYTKELSNDGYFDASSEHVEPALISCFRLAFDAVDEEVKKKVAKWFAKLYNEGSDQVISGYGTAFIRISDMKRISKDDAIFVKQHLLGRLNNNVDELILDSLFGIGSFLEKSDVQKFIDPIVIFICQTSILQTSLIKVFALFMNESLNIDNEIQKEIMNRLERWAKSYRNKGDKESESRVIDLRTI